MLTYKALLESATDSVECPFESERDSPQAHLAFAVFVFIGVWSAGVIAPPSFE